MVRSFELVCVPEIRERIRAIQTAHRNWEEFKLALKDDYFMEDSERVTKRTFLEWVTKPKIGISATGLLREFEKRYAQLSRIERTTLDREKTELFLQAAGKDLQEKLEILLEDKDTEQGLKNNWNDVLDAVTMLAKRHRRRDKMVMSSITPITTTLESPPKRTVTIPKAEGPMEELIKGIRDLKLKMSRLEERGQSSMQAPIQKPQSKEGFTYRCIWCDDPEHAKKRLCKL